MEKMCPTCGQPFAVSPSSAARRVFCSRLCLSHHTLMSPPTPLPAWARWVACKLREHKMTRQDLAKALGLSANAVTDLLKGRRVPRRSTVRALEHLFGSMPNEAAQERLAANLRAGERTCVVCGQPIASGRGRNARTCSLPCEGKLRWETRRRRQGLPPQGLAGRCKVCQAPVKVTPSHAQIYCSRRCQSAGRSRIRPQTPFQQMVFAAACRYPSLSQAELAWGLGRGVLRYLLAHPGCCPTGKTLRALADALGVAVDDLRRLGVRSHEERTSELGKRMVGKIRQLYPPGSPQLLAINRRAGEKRRGIKRPPEVVARMVAGITPEGRQRCIAALRRYTSSPQHKLRSALQAWVSNKGRLPSEDEMWLLAQRWAARLDMPVRQVTEWLWRIARGKGKGGRPPEETRWQHVHGLVTAKREAGGKVDWLEVAQAVLGEGSRPSRLDAESLRSGYYKWLRRQAHPPRPLVRLTPGRCWTAEEQERLQRLWPDKEACLAALPRRSWRAIQAKARRLRLPAAGRQQTTA